MTGTPTPRQPARAALRGLGHPELVALVREVQNAHSVLVAIRARPHDSRAVGDMAELKAAYAREDAALDALLAFPLPAPTEET